MNLSKVFYFSNSFEKYKVLLLFTKTIAILSVLFLVSCQSKVTRFEAKTFQSKNLNMTLPYQILLPKQYKQNKKYPLIIHLHGSDKRGTDNQKPLERVEEYFYEAQKHTSCIVLVPQCPKNITWESPNIKKIAFELIEEIEKNYNIDSQRIYLTGLSMGGFGVWNWLESYPQKFAAVIAICGGGNPEKASTYKNTKCWIFHGVKDKSVSVEYSREMNKALKNAGAKPKYTEYKDLGHKIWDEAFQEKEIWQWLFEQKKI